MWPTRGARAEGQGRVGEADRRAERALLLGLERIHFQTPFSLCSRTLAAALSLCVCFRPAARPLLSPLSRSACSLCTVLVFHSVVVLASDFVVALHLHFSVTFMYCSD